MARDWLLVRVELIYAGELEDAATDVRTLLVGPSHTFGQLAEAVNLAFARWGLGCNFEFRLPGQRPLGHSAAKADRPVSADLSKDDSFTLVFDDNRRLTHRCHVVGVNVDVRKELGFTPRQPIAREALAIQTTRDGRRGVSQLGR
jgi:hypothetical protein